VRGCRELNADCEVVGYEMRLVVGGDGGREVVDVFEEYDIVLDCTDNPATRYLISDLCVLLGKTLISGAAQKLEGQVLALNYPVPAGAATTDAGSKSERGPCYRCVFPTPPSPDMVKSCGEIGILGPVVGTIGTLMTTEALRIIVKGDEEVRKPTMLLYSAWPTDPRGMFRTIGLRGRRKDCLACGHDDELSLKGLRRITKDEILEGRMDYVAFCGLLEDLHILGEDERISAKDFLSGLTGDTETKKENKWTNPIIIDTREPQEVDMGPKIGGSVNVPLTRILRKNGSIEEMEALLHDGNHDAMLFVCQLGNDSQIAAKKMLEARPQKHEISIKADGDEKNAKEGNGSRAVFIADITGGFAAIEKAIQRSSV